jgi:hypothetical protein
VRPTPWSDRALHAFWWFATNYQIDCAAPHAVIQVCTWRPSRGVGRTVAAVPVVISESATFDESVFTLPELNDMWIQRVVPVEQNDAPPLQRHTWSCIQADVVLITRPRDRRRLKISSW